MRAVVQRVSQASVAVAGKTLGKIDKGFLVLLGVSQDDQEADVNYLVRKISHLRVLKDKHQKMNLSLKDVNGAMLVISQFTLYADTKKGNRPSFIKAARPGKAKRLYQMFIDQVRSLGIKVATGNFGAMMQVSLTNDGPVTIVLDSQEK